MIKTVLFDLDGTIIDTNELIIQSFIHALWDQNRLLLTREQIIPHMGKTLVNQLKSLSGQEDVEVLVDVYRAYNLRMHDEMVCAFPYVREVIEQLHQCGIHMGIVTTKMRKTADMGMHLCGLDKYIKAVITLDDVIHPKPHPEPVEKAVKLLGADIHQTLMLGDSPYDIEAANRAGVISAGVSWSLKGEEALKPYHPDYMISDMRELLQIVGVERDIQ
jgi:pyrophosphatase PpaX